MESRQTNRQPLNAMSEWEKPVRISLNKEMFHDLEERSAYMDQRCRMHSRVLDTPPTGRNNEWKAGPSLTGTIGIALYWIHRVRIRVWRKKSGMNAPYSTHPTHTYSRWCGGILCDNKKRCPHTKLGIPNFGIRDLTDTRPHHRFRNEGHLEYLKCGRPTCVLCEPARHDANSCPGSDAGCDECRIT